MFDPLSLVVGIVLGVLGCIIIAAIGIFYILNGFDGDRRD